MSTSDLCSTPARTLLAIAGVILVGVACATRSVPEPSPQSAHGQSQTQARPPALTRAFEDQEPESSDAEGSAPNEHHGHVHHKSPAQPTSPDAGVSQEGGHDGHHH